MDNPKQTEKSNIENLKEIDKKQEIKGVNYEETIKKRKKISKHIRDEKIKNDTNKNKILFNKILRISAIFSLIFIISITTIYTLTLSEIIKIGEEKFKIIQDTFYSTLKILLGIILGSIGKSKLKNNL